MRRASLAVLIIAGCGRIGFGIVPVAGDAPTDAAPGDPVVGISGTRLRAERWVAPDGASVFADWYDSQLATRCMPGHDTSGTLRCYPEQAQLGFAYSDPACTVPIAKVSDGCSLPTVAFKLVGNAIEAYTLGAVYTGTIYTTSAGCSAAALTGTFVDVGAQVPDTALVSGALTTVDAGDGLAFLDEQWADGAYGRISGGAQYQGAECDLEREGSNEFCVPATILNLDLQAMTYYDAACTIPATQDPGMPAFSIVDTSRACFEQRVVVAGPPHPNTTQLYYRPASGGCAGSAIAPATVVELVDAALGRPALTYAAAPGTTRLRTAGYATQTGGLFAQGMFDTQLGSPCNVLATSATTAICAAYGETTSIRVSLDTSCAGAPQQLYAVCGGVHAASYAGVVCNESLAALTDYSPQLMPPAVTTNALGLGCVAVDLTGAQLFGSASMPADTSSFETLTRVRD